jgi:hypothetical protein
MIGRYILIYLLLQISDRLVLSVQLLQHHLSELFEISDIRIDNT